MGVSLSAIKLGMSVGYRLLLPRLSKLNVAVTFRCNYKCAICAIWKHSAEQNPAKEITAIEVERIIKTNKLMWMSYTGGEPFLNGDIKNILAVSVKNCRMVSVISNASQPEFIQDCITAARCAGDAIIVLSLSLEGSKTEHDKIVGVPDSFERVIDVIGRIKALKHLPALYVNIETTMMLQNNGLYLYTQTDTAYLESLAKRLDVNISYNAIQYAPYYHNSDVVSNVREVPQQKMMTLNAFSLVKSLFLATKPNYRRYRCVAGQYSYFVDPYGTLYPCLFKTPVEPLLNLRDTKYRINGVDCKDSVRKCKGCHTPCETYTTALFRPWRLLRR